MIARIWHGVTLTEKGEAFYRFMRRTGEKAYRRAKGNRGVYILRRPAGDKTEFLLISLWDSSESIKRFAGEEYEKAYYPFPEEKDYLIELEPEVKHFDVLVGPDDSPDPKPLRIGFTI